MAGVWLGVVLLVALGAACRKGKGARARGDGGPGRDGQLAVDAPGAEAVAADGVEDPRPLPLPPCPQPRVTPSASSGVLRVHLPADPAHLDPFDDDSEATSAVLLGLVHETVLSCGGRGGAAEAPGPGVASAELNPAGDLITLRVRPGAQFHDGRPVTHIDLRASLEMVWRGGARLPYVRAALAEVAALDLGGPGVLRLRLKHPAPIVLRALCDVPVAPAAWLGKRRTPARNQPIGSGPFRFASWTRGKTLTLVRFAQAGLPPPALAGVEFHVEADTGRALARLRRSDLDLMPRLDPVHYPDQLHPAALGPHVSLYTFAGERFTFMALNHRRPPLGELPFRRALNQLWDRQGLGGELHRGLVVPTATPWPTTVPVPHLDPEAAAGLLRAGNLLPAPTRRAVPIRFRLQLLHSGGRQARAELRRFAERLRRVGVLVELTAVELPQLAERLRGGDFDLALVSWNSRPFEDPRPRFGAHGAFNYGAFHSSRTEALLDELRGHDGPTTRAALDQQLGAQLADELPAIFLYRHRELALASTRVTGLCHRAGRLDFSHAYVPAAAAPPSADAAPPSPRDAGAAP